MTKYFKFVVISDCFKVFLDYAQVLFAQHFFGVNFHKVYVSLLVVNNRPFMINFWVKAHRLYLTINKVFFHILRHLVNWCSLFQFVFIKPEWLIHWNVHSLIWLVASSILLNWILVRFKKHILLLILVDCDGRIEPLLLFGLFATAVLAVLPSVIVDVFWAAPTLIVAHT